MSFSRVLVLCLWCVPMMTHATGQIVLCQKPDGRAVLTLAQLAGCCDDECTPAGAPAASPAASFSAVTCCAHAGVLAEAAHPAQVLPRGIQHTLGAACICAPQHCAKPVVRAARDRSPLVRSCPALMLRTVVLLA